MTRREFRLISGQGAGPSIEDLPPGRRPKRRHFKTLQSGTGTSPHRLRAVTIKGIDKTDGTTVWEYGPGSFWRHHYGADAISGVVPNLSATLNKYAVVASAYPAFANCGNRNSGTLAANAAEALAVTKLDSLDGTVVESATLTGMFCDTIGTSFVGLMAGISISNAAALSGGDYVIVGERLPFIEFVDFTSNTANKEYILHAHGQQAGSVYLKTRTSSETITIPQNSTAGAVETLFEATSDCVSATATGGPWPLKPISIEVEWSVSSGDIAAISATNTATASGVGVDYDYSDVYNGGDNSYTSTLTVNTLNIGSIWKFKFDGTGPYDPSSEFSYTSATDNANDFITALTTAFSAYQSSHSGEPNWGAIVLISGSGNQLAVEYDFDARFLRLTIENGGGTTDSRRAGSCAAAYDTGTGEMTSAVGYVFGYSEDRPTLKMFAETDDIPSVTGLNVLGLQSIGSGPSNTVVITPNARNSGDYVKANVVEKWDISGGAWAFDWQIYCNATQRIQQIVQVESGYALCPIKAKRFDGSRDRTAAKLLVSDGSVTEVNTTFGSMTAPNNSVDTAMFDNDHSNYLSFNYSILYNSDTGGSGIFRINGHGADTWIDGTEFRIGSQVFAADATAVYSFHSSSSNVTFDFDAIGEFADHDVYMKFFATYNKRAAEPTQFRFVVENMPGVNYTAWIDWYSTQAEIETALNALLGAGNCSIIDFGGLATPVANNPVALIECNPMIQFLTDSGYGPGSGFIPTGYLQYLALVFRGGISIETRNDTLFAAPGIASYDRTDATLLWTRPWGTRGGLPDSTPLYAWLEGDFVYAYGNVVDAEL